MIGWTGLVLIGRADLAQDPGAAGFLDEAAARPLPAGRRMRRPRGHVKSIGPGFAHQRPYATSAGASSDQTIGGRYTSAFSRAWHARAGSGVHHTNRCPPASPTRSLPPQTKRGAARAETRRVAGPSAD